MTTRTSGSSRNSTKAWPSPSHMSSDIALRFCGLLKVMTPPPSATLCRILPSAWDFSVVLGISSIGGGFRCWECGPRGLKHCFGISAMAVRCSFGLRRCAALSRGRMGCGCPPATPALAEGIPAPAALAGVDLPRKRRGVIQLRISARSQGVSGRNVGRRNSRLPPSFDRTPHEDHEQGGCRYRGDGRNESPIFRRRQQKAVSNIDRYASHRPMRQIQRKRHVREKAIEPPGTCEVEDVRDERGEDE